ncbi:hypothetical protein WJX81_001935 [Elliptochloris bilobata]|uniref:Patatin n=1 Tax=Elliptochloris bilobata TaxID=381761 RepID=A0AAW1QC10_9CHLO
MVAVIATSLKVSASHEDWLSDDNVDVSGAERLAEQLRQAGTSLPAESKAEGRARPKQTWTFSSSGWLFVYHFGVVRALKELRLTRDIHVIGSSGGACAASYLFLDVDVEKTVDFICDCALYARSHWLGPFKVQSYVKGALRNFLPRDAAKRLTGNMEVSVTTLPWLGNARVTEFADNAEMENAILASSCVFPAPPVYLPKMKSWALDGGYSDFQLIKGALLGRSFFSFHKMEDAVSVTPFYMSRADIKPSKYIPFWWCVLPPAPDKLRGLYKLGYRDAVMWLSQNSRIPYGVMPEHQEAAEEEKPLWWTIVQESAASARSCDSELGDLAVSLGAVLRNMGRCALWVLIACELAAQAALSALIVALSPLLRGMTTASAWNRFGAVTQTAVTPWVLLKAIPGISATLPLRRKPRLRAQLAEHSLLYRFFQFLL